MQVGFVLLMGHVAVAASGIEFLHFVTALILLGVGWNFAFVGGTALLTQSYRPSEQTKVQALNEGLVFGLVALGSLGAGWLYDRFGWVTRQVVRDRQHQQQHRFGIDMRHFGRHLGVVGVVVVGARNQLRDAGGAARELKDARIGGLDLQRGLRSA